MQVAVLTALCAGVFDFMFIPENDVNTVAEWQSSQAIPTAGTCVWVEGAVGDPPANNGVALGW